MFDICYASKWSKEIKDAMTSAVKEIDFFKIIRTSYKFDLAKMLFSLMSS